MSERLDRARMSLQGLSVGDALGERFFSVALESIRRRELPEGPWSYTDDTEMALSIFEVLEHRGRIDQDRLAVAFAVRYSPRRGYGGGAHQLLEAIGSSPSGMWRSLTPAMFGGRGSYGNGAAMRVAPLGAFFCDDLERAAHEARLSAQVTHSHAEGIAGAIAVAVAAAWMSGQHSFDSESFWRAILSATPSGRVRDGIEQAQAISPRLCGYDAGQALGNGHLVSAQDTVPFCLWCAARSPEDFQEAFWTSAEGMGDIDTCCAIVGGIVGCRDQPPEEWIRRREPLPL